MTNDIYWQTQADMHHLWYGHQAVMRMQSLLMAAVYNKVLERKDFSSAVAVSTSVKAPGSLQKISIKTTGLEQVGKGKSECVTFVHRTGYGLWHKCIVV